MAWPVTLPTFTGAMTAGVATALEKLSDALAVLGNAWTTDARSATTIWGTTGVSLGTGTLVSRYRLAGKTLDWRLSLTIGSSTNTGSGQFTFTYPAGWTPLNSGDPVAVILNDASGSTYEAVGVLTGSQINIRVLSSAAGATTTVTGSSPFTWATGDTLNFRLVGAEGS